MSASRQEDQRKSLARACQFCRERKIRCDTNRPRCGSCVSQQRDCAYKLQPPKQRPTSAAIDALRKENKKLQKIIQELRVAPPEKRTTFPGSNHSHTTTETQPRTVQQDEDDDLDSQLDEDLDVSPFFSLDEMRKLDSFGPSSALQASPHRPVPAEYATIQQIRSKLIANAVLQRQREYELHQLPDIDGVPTSLAMHLLDLHWNRQHHTFLLTYRPAITRDLLQGGPYCSKFLLNAIFAGASKYSMRVDVRETIADPSSAGARFYRRCDELLAQESLLMIPSIPTIVGLLLLGASFNARGATSKGWLYTGYALRMIYDQGLHLDTEATYENAEEVEIRRRVFWGAFICDKLQSLYLGRPAAIQLRDAHVSRHLMDTMEEKELWIPLIPTASTEAPSPAGLDLPTPIYSVSTFQQFCLLSKIMTKIINKFYVVGATAANARASLEVIDDSLVAWQHNLPRELNYEPPLSSVVGSRQPPPNMMCLHGVYHSLIILLHRPLISDGHLRSAIAPASSWKRCTDAARNITTIALAYQSTYSLRGAPYVLSYAIYVACTIHVRNAAALETTLSGEHCSMLVSSLKCLDELSIPNPGVMKLANIIRKLIEGKNLGQVIDTNRTSLIQQEQSYENLPAADLDLDAIFRMFPSGDFENLQDDLLYGFMDTQSGDQYEFTASFFGTNPP